MSTSDKRSFVTRALTFILGTDQRSVVIGAILACLAIGIGLWLNIVDIGSRPRPPFYWVFAEAVLFGIVLMPFFFVCLCGLWAFRPRTRIAVAIGCMLFVIVLQRMSVKGATDPFVVAVSVIGFVGLAFLTAQWIRQLLKANV